MFTHDYSHDDCAIPGLSFRGFVIRAIIGGVVILGAISLGAVWFFGSINCAVAALHGHEVIIEEVLPSPDNPSAPQSLSIVAVNLSSNEVSLLGAEASCSCIYFNGIPATIPPRGRCVIEAKEKLDSSRTVASKVVIWTSSHVDPQVMTFVPPLKGT